MDSRAFRPILAPHAWLTCSPDGGAISAQHPAVAVAAAAVAVDSEDPACRILGRKMPTPRDGFPKVNPYNDIFMHPPQVPQWADSRITFASGTCTACRPVPQRSTSHPPTDHASPLLVGHLISRTWLHGSAKLLHGRINSCMQRIYRYARCTGTGIPVDKSSLWG